MEYLVVKVFNCELRKALLDETLFALLSDGPKPVQLLSVGHQVFEVRESKGTKKAIAVGARLSEKVVILVQILTFRRID